MNIPNNDSIMLDKIFKPQETLETLKTLYVCGIMEKVWDELKKIEAQAEQIQNNAHERAKNMVLSAKQNSEKLIENSRIYAEEESQKLFSNAVKEANLSREELLKANQEATEKLKAKAEKRMEKAVRAVLNEVLEETKH